MSNRSFTQLLEQAKAGDAYWVDKAALEFTEGLCERMDQQGVSRAEFARRLGVSRGYVTKVLRGNVNITLETMVKLARAVGGEVDVRVREPVTHRQWSVEPKRPDVPKYPLSGFKKVRSNKPMKESRRDTPIAA